MLICHAISHQGLAVCRVSQVTGTVVEYGDGVTGTEYGGGVTGTVVECGGGVTGTVQGVVGSQASTIVLFCTG